MPAKTTPKATATHGNHRAFGVLMCMLVLTFHTAFGETVSAGGYLRTEVSKDLFPCLLSYQMTADDPVDLLAMPESGYDQFLNYKSNFTYYPELSESNTKFASVEDVCWTSGNDEDLFVLAYNGNLLFSVDVIEFEVSCESVATDEECQDPDGGLYVDTLLLLVCCFCGIGGAIWCLCLRNPTPKPLMMMGGPQQPGMMYGAPHPQPVAPMYATPPPQGVVYAQAPMPVTAPAPVPAPAPAMVPAPTGPPA